MVTARWRRPVAVHADHFAEVRFRDFEHTLEINVVGIDDSGAWIFHRPYHPTHFPSREEIDSVVLPSDAKALLPAVLAQQYPDRRTELVAACRRLNVERSFPFHL